jgi:two-component system sensor histidine kinase HydH
MQIPEEEATDESLAKLTAKAYYDLGIAKSEMEEKENLIKNLASQSTEIFNQEKKTSKDVKDKIIFLQELASSLSKKNEELEKRNKSLEEQELQNSKLTEDLRRNLGKVVLKEKELELQRDQLRRQVDETTGDLLKSEKLAVIGELASRMAHDLRNPLSTIKNVVEIVESKPRMKIEEKLMFYGKLRRAIERMSHQVDDVLGFVRETELFLEPNSIYDLLRSAKEGLIIPNDVTINIEESDARITCDARKIEAVFINLMMNAIQATDTVGTVNVMIIDNGNDVMVAIEDSGPGITPDVLPKIFDPLFTTKQTGTGLGLSICKNIIEQHGGSITVKNHPTTFVVRIPKNSSE